jgi:hypothetical protein
MSHLPNHSHTLKSFCCIVTQCGLKETYCLRLRAQDGDNTQLRLSEMSRVECWKLSNVLTDSVLPSSGWMCVNCLCVFGIVKDIMFLRSAGMYLRVQTMRRHNTKDQHQLTTCFMSTAFCVIGMSGGLLWARFHTMVASFLTSKE